MKKPKPYKFLIYALLIMACTIRETGPDLYITQPHLVLGEISFDSMYTVRYNLRNKGGTSLLIDTITTSCGCSVPTIDSKIIAPGRTATLEVSFKPADTGRFNKKILIKSNTDSSFSVVSFSGRAVK